MKKILALLLIAIMAASLVACNFGTNNDDPGKTVDPSNANTPNDTPGNNQNTPPDEEDPDPINNDKPGDVVEYDPPDFGEFNIDNYNEIMKTYFGLDISTFDKWEVRYALTDTERIGNGINANRISLQGRYTDAEAYNELKDLFEKTKAVSNGTVWARKYQFGKSISWTKGDAYTNFEEYALFYDNTLVPSREGVSLLWLYEYNEHTIFINLDMSSGSFRLLAYFLN